MRALRACETENGESSWWIELSVPIEELPFTVGETINFEGHKENHSKNSQLFLALRDGDGSTRVALFEGYWPPSMAKESPLAPFSLEFATDVCPCDDETFRQRYAIDVATAGNTTRVFDGGVGYINAPEPSKVYVPTAGGPRSCGAFGEDWALSVRLDKHPCPQTASRSRTVNSATRSVR